MSDRLAGRYRLHAELGRGGLGSVWRATDLHTGREVAIKRLHHEYNANAGLQRRLLREARAVARLDHPNIVRLLDVGDDDGAFLVMELVAGLSLLDFAQHNPSTSQLLDVSDQILGALAYAHARGVVHRDLNPMNVLVSRAPSQVERRVSTHNNWTGPERRRPHIKLLDFGFAWVEDDLDDDISLTNREVFGNPSYMAPEQAMREEQVGASADVYAAAVMIWELFCGAPPYDGPTGASVLMQHLNAPIPTFKPRPQLAVPSGLGAWLAQALQKDPAQRFHSAGAMRRALASLTQAPIQTVDIALPALSTTDAFVGVSLDGSLDTGSINTGSINTLSGLGLTPAAETPLIGQDALLRWLWTHVVAVCSMPAPPRIVILEGASGAGRTRLCTWLCQAVAEGGWMSVAMGRRQVGAPSALRSALRSALNLGDPEPDDRLAQVELRLAQIGARELDPPTVVRCLWPQTGPCPIARVRQTIEALVRRLARRQPLLICLDDLHHARASDVDLVEHLVLTLDRKPAPVLLLCTRRDLPLMGQPSAAGSRVAGFLKRRQELLHVGRVARLVDADVEALVQQALLVHPDVATQVAQAARGNPLIARQALAWLMESGAIRRDPDVGLHQFTARPPRLPAQPARLVAERVHAAFARSRHRDSLRALCPRLALVGEAFAFDLVAALARQLGIPHADLVLAIDTLIKIGVLADGANDTLAFSNSIFRDLFLAEAEAHPDLAELHRQVGDVKAEWHGDVDDLAASELALHYLAAEDFAQAIRHQLRAARHARDALRFKLSMARYAEAHRWLNTARNVSVSLRREVLVGLADVVLALRQAERGLRLADELARLADAHTDPMGQLQAQAIRGEALLALGRLTAAEDVLGRIAQSAREFAALAARIALTRGRVAARQGALPAARAQVIIAINAARAQAPEIEAHAWQMLGEINLKSGDTAAAIESLQTAADRVRGSVDEPLRGAIHWRLGELHRRAGTFDAAIPHFREAADAFEAAGSLSNLGRSLRGLGDAQWAVGNPEAQTSYRRAIEAFRPLGDGYQLAVCLTQLGRAAMELDDFEAAEAALEQATTHLEPLGDLLRLGLLHAFRAQIAQARGMEGVRDLHLEAALNCDAQQPMVVPEWAEALERLTEPMEVEQPARARQLLGRAIAVWRALSRGQHAERLQQHRETIGT